MMMDSMIFEHVDGRMMPRLPYEGSQLRATGERYLMLHQAAAAARVPAMQLAMEWSATFAEVLAEPTTSNAPAPQPPPAFEPLGTPYVSSVAGELLAMAADLRVIDKRIRELRGNVAAGVIVGADPADADLLHSASQSLIEIGHWLSGMAHAWSIGLINALREDEQQDEAAAAEPAIAAAAVVLPTNQRRRRRARARGARR